MGNCLLVNQDLSLNITDLEDLLLAYEQNYSGDYIPDELPEVCHGRYCSVFGDHIPVFLMALGILGLLSSMALVMALAKFPRLWGEHRPSRTILSLMTAATGLFAAILLVFGAGWKFGDTFCKMARAMQYGSLFAQGLLVARSSCLRWGPSHLLLAMMLWAVGFLLSVPIAMISVSGGDDWAVCVLRPQAKLDPWNIAHIVLCGSVFFILPMLMGLVKLMSTWCKCSRCLRIDPTWLFYLFWAPYGLAIILKMLFQEELLSPSCHSQEVLSHFLGLSEGLGMLHCVLCPLFVMGAAVHRQRATQAVRR